MRKLVVAPLTAVALVVALVVAAVPASSSTSVSVRDNKFVPRSVTIRRGGVVKWVWRGQVAHNVTFRGSVHSTTKRRGTFSHRFSRAGTFRYRCTIHPGMVGTIRVK
jgi:plastocyanin